MNIIAQQLMENMFNDDALSFSINTSEGQKGNLKERLEFINKQIDELQREKKYLEEQVSVSN